MFPIFADWELFVPTLEADRLKLPVELDINIDWLLAPTTLFGIDEVYPTEGWFLLLKEAFIIFWGPPLLVVCTVDFVWPTIPPVILFCLF